ncbi:MAG: peptidylprolyl isomerase [Pirellulaceae bacterium]|nr:peptidylprolyl isomerase [Pirellulaceae bacterium]
MTHLFPRLFVATLAITFSLALTASPSQGQQFDPAQNPVNTNADQQMQVLAVINGEQITRHTLAEECLRRYGKTVLENIVNKILVLNECQRRGIVITERDINDEILNHAKAVGLSGERYMETICSRRNITADQYKNDIVWMQLALRRLAQGQIEVTPREIDEQIEFEYGPKVQVREIVSDSREEAEQLLKMAMANPEQFGDLAKRYSKNPASQAMKGLLPPVALHSGAPKNIERMIFSMTPGQISEVMEIAPNQYVILQCERLFPGIQLTEQQLAMEKEKLVSKISEIKLADAATDLFKQLQDTVSITNVMNDPELSKQHPGIAAKVDNYEIPLRMLAEECIARFANDMLEIEINRALLLQALKQSGQQVTREDIDNEIIRAAESFGYLTAQGEVDIQAWLNYTTNNDASKIDFYIEDEVWPTCALKKLVANRVSVTDDDMQKGFEANFGPQVEVLAIVLNDHRRALTVWNMASGNPTEEFFGKLAAQYSIEDASRANNGLVPPIQKHGGRPELEREAFSLKVGEISKVVQVDQYYIILYCMGHTEPKVFDFDAVRDTLRSDILEKKTRIAMNETFLKLRDDAQIDNYLTGTSQASRAQRMAAQNQEGRPQR